MVSRVEEERPSYLVECLNRKYLRSEANLDRLVSLTGHILQGMCAQKEPYFGMVEDAVGMAKAALVQLLDDSEH